MVYLNLSKCREESKRSKEIKYLKGIFGENWKEGARNSKDVDKVTDADIKKARDAKYVQKEQQVNNILKESITDLNKQGRISGQQRDRMNNIVDQI